MIDVSVIIVKLLEVVLSLTVNNLAKEIASFTEHIEQVRLRTSSKWCLQSSYFSHMTLE